MATPDEQVNEMRTMLGNVVHTVQALGVQLNIVSGRVQGTGNVDEIRTALADLELKISEFRSDRGRREEKGMPLNNPKDIRLREFTGEDNKGFQRLSRRLQGLLRGDQARVGRTGRVDRVSAQDTRHGSVPPAVRRRGQSGTPAPRLAPPQAQGLGANVVQGQRRRRRHPYLEGDA